MKTKNVKNNQVKMKNRKVFLSTIISLVGVIGFFSFAPKAEAGMKINIAPKNPDTLSTGLVGLWSFVGKNNELI